jgi:acetyltransferase
MVEGVAEVILGIHNDAQVGPAVVFGLGGVLVEALKDVAIRVAPINFDDAFEMIHEIRGKELLLGFRGRPRGDLHALAQGIVSLSKLAWDFKDKLQELDINPLIVLPEGKGVHAVDILAVMKS